MLPDVLRLQDVRVDVHAGRVHMHAVLDGHPQLRGLLDKQPVVLERVLLGLHPADRNVVHTLRDCYPALHVVFNDRLQL